MPKQPSPSSGSAEPETSGSTLSAIAKGLAEHKGLLYGFGVVLALSATCQIVRTDFTLYAWITLAIYLTASGIWLITTAHGSSRKQTGVGDSNVAARSDDRPRPVGGDDAVSTSGFSTVV